VDLLPIKKIPNVITFTEDITTDKCVALIKRELRDGMVDCVLHDGAPNVGGATWSRDAYQQIELVLCSLKMATQFLRQGGTFVTKVFRSQDYDALLWVLKQFFKIVTVTKPASSRIASAETFVVCQGYLAPKKIDPKLLSPAHVFSSTDTRKAVDVLHEKAPKKNREGYSDDASSLLFSKGSVSEFIEGAVPGEVLGKYNCIEFDAPSAVYLNHESTTSEIKALCADLKVLGMSVFSALMKWRKKLLLWKKALLAEAAPTKIPKSEELPPTTTLTKDELDDLDDEKVTEQLEALKAKKLKDDKKQKKIEASTCNKAEKTT
jgi:AdoMet-dependent rRNA methyltransferase SPB1